MKTLLIISISLFVWQGWPHLDAWLISQGNKAIHSQEKMATAQKRTVYKLDRQAWTVFPILPKQNVLRVLSNATIPHTHSLNSELEWQYVLHYQILDKTGQLLSEQTYHQRTKVTVYQDRHAENRVRAVFYIDPNQQPTDGRNMLINLSDTPNAALVRLRLQSADPDIIDVGIRVYWQQTWDEFKLDYLWLRLSDREKRDLTRGSLYEHDLLTQQEKRNLLRERWAVIGPLGVSGREYYPREIYIHKEMEGDIVRLPVESYGILVNGLHWVTVPLLEQGGQIHLHFSEALPLPGQPATQLPVKITVKWYGRQSKERSTHTFVWDGSENGFESEFAGGLLEISADQAVMMRVFLKKAKVQEITPPPVHLSTTLIQKDMPAEFKINHVQRQSIPVRINLRRLLERNALTEPSPCRVTYTLLNAKGGTQKTGTMPLTQARSFYDRSTKQWWEQFEVSDADSYYILIPPKSVTLRLTSPCMALVAVYNRPTGLLRTTRIPEDYYYTPDKSERLPAWFRLRPQNYAVLSEQNRTPLLRIQRRPPSDEADIEIMAGRYTWEDYRPEGQYRSRYLLTLRDSELPIRDQALGAFYQEIPKNSPLILQFVNTRRTIQPNLIYFRQTRKPVKIRILLDNRLHYEGYLTGYRGELKLPKFTATTHRLHLKVIGPGQFLINHAKPKEGQAIYIKRLAHRFDAKGLQFTYEKRSQDKELVSARVYLPKETQERLQVQVTLGAEAKIKATHNTGWTFPQRQYDLRAAGEGEIVVLNKRNEFVDVGQFFVIPLQDDLPAGEYQITLKPQKTLGAYLTLSKITAGLEEQRQFFSETQPYELLF
ncbi:MAG: hypothetical protein VSS75_030170 [Candidatus Parabeggiatoa sp.]|nr:hypothetical protein [Candidatus Parabeggiatoa sp.]